MPQCDDGDDSDDGDGFLDPDDMRALMNEHFTHPAPASEAQR